ncbi:NRAMP family divalent metal transporter [Burkholderia ubonensis]|uniref:Manganese transporter n=1 Tax=Burkholderia ubonensis TaxID=101571 RepID=A0AAU8UKY9_9BURK|nr:NRAMP family divalent metal transporter [Burkholderia ubonensis]AJX13945.1 natural resistance-associated macrophage family protein [Burkholderia ubonensis MSMB22]AOK26975.1 manganese transporter [Burkholderia ubonensis]KVD14029.1 manganese transporter [Burkholderia ubonensis]KVD28211.1 manganese transporter [Burkholderia ubonensis]KVD39379.1 manganese transporter [Burkholderia ubonensis]
MSTPSNVSPPIAVERGAVLDDAHLGDIRGAFGTIAHHDTAPRGTWRARLRTLLAIIGPGLIVMVGDNDAGAFGTYTQAGQNYGTTLLWTLLLLVPVLYVNQEMVLRLGAVTGVGHARLIFERFGKFWGAFSVIDLFLLNALTIVTEFIGITFVLDFFGLPKVAGVCVAAALTMAAVSTGDFRRFERFAVVLCVMSLLLVPVLVTIHPPVAQMSRDFFVPAWPAHAKLSDVMLLVIGVVGTTVAPWQLFFQQSYVIDKRITPRFMKYEKADLWIGIVFVLIGAVAMIGFSAALFGGHPEFGNFTDAGGVIAGLEKYAGRTSATLFAVALLDACIIGAAAVSLSTAYAIGDVFKIRHSLHRNVSDAKGFYLVYFGIVAAAATLVLIPGSPLGLLTEAVQTLAGVLLPSATVFLLLLCNDRQVLGPWVNSTKLNVFTSAVIWVLVLLSIILTASVMYPDISGDAIVDVLVGGTVFAIAGYLATVLIRRNKRVIEPGVDRSLRDTWRMPPLDTLEPQVMTLSTRIWMGVLRGYLVIAVGLVIVKVVQMMLLR